MDNFENDREIIKVSSVQDSYRWSMRLSEPYLCTVTHCSEVFELLWKSESVS
jgi:hypothetical protein